MIIGIDPGNTGAIAFLGDDFDFWGVYDMPLMANGKKNQVNASGLRNILLEALCQSGKPYSAHMIYLEKVGAMPGQGVASMFNFGMGFGVVQGVIAGLFIPFSLVTPQTWKKRAGLLGKEKDNARTLAQQLYPSAPLDRKKDIGRADAILIARYGKEARVV